MSCVWVECVLNVLLCGENSSVQQHRCGKSLPGQRQRQVPPRHDHLPVTDHLSALEQHRRRHQVGVSGRKAYITVPSSGGSLLHHRWNGGLGNICRWSKNKSTWCYLLWLCREGKNQNEKTFSLPAEEVFQAIYRFVFSVWRLWIVCESIHVFYSNSDLRRRW